MSLRREPWPVILCGVFFYVTILLCWRWTWWLFVLLALSSVALLASKPTPRNLIVWLLGTLSSTYGAYWRARHGIWAFAMADWAGLPAWIVWVWGTLMLCSVRLVEWMVPNLEAKLLHRPRARMALFGAGAALAIGYGVVVIRTLSPVFDWMAVVMSLVVVACRPGHRHLIFFWMTALLGFVAELTGLAVGIYAYAVPVFARWELLIVLQFAWGLSGLLLYCLSEVGERSWRQPLS